MSIAIMTMVWNKFPGSGTELLGMLKLADYSNDEGFNIYPSMATIAKHLRVSESQARRTIHKLIDAGWINVVGNKHGGAPGTTRRYQINIDKLIATPSIGATPRIGARDPLHPCAGTPSAGASQSIIDPLKNHQSPHNPPKGGKPAIGIKKFLSRCKDVGEKPIPENDPVFTYAAEVGIPVEWIWLCWMEFVQRNIESQKRYKDWQKAFRNCVRGNWYKLWYAKADGEVGLTTQGIMAQKKHREAA